MMRSLSKIEDFRIFAAVKVDDGYNIIALPQPLSVSYDMLYANTSKKYVIEWDQDVSKALYSDLSNFILLYKYNPSNKKIDTEVLHVVSYDYSTCGCDDLLDPILYRYRFAVNFVLMPDEEAIVGIMNNYFRQKINNLRSNDVDTITVDELQIESDNMTNTLTDTFLVFRNARRAILVVMPTITDIYYNAPHTTVKWSDGSTTTVAATSGEEFNKELGLAMAMSRKYCECMGLEHPRAGFKRMVDNAHDQTAKTAARKAYKNSKKQKLLTAADVSTEKDSSNGHSANL